MRPFVVASLALSAFGLAHAHDAGAATGLDAQFASPQDFQPSDLGSKVTQQAQSAEFKQQQPSEADMPNPFGDELNFDFLKNLKNPFPVDPEMEKKSAADNLLRYFFQLGQEDRLSSLGKPELSELINVVKDHKENAFDDIRGTMKFFNDEKNSELRQALLDQLTPFQQQFAEMEREDKAKLEEETMKIFRSLFSEEGEADNWFQDFAKMFEGFGLEDGAAAHSEL